MIISITETIVDIGGHTVDGWSEDTDALTMPDAFELATVRRGASGQMAAFPTGDRGGPVTIKLLPDSESAKVFMQQALLSLQGEPSIFDGGIQNSRQRFSFALKRGILTTAPLGQTMGKGEVANLMFTFEFEEIVPNYDGVNAAA